MSYPPIRATVCALICLFVLSAFATSQVHWPVSPPAPPNTGSEATLVPDGEPGEPLTIEGTVFAPDGETPVSGVVVYAYNTDAQGYYRPDKGVWPPRLHAWVKTDARGHFTLHTIRPGHYPNMRIPAHVHTQLWGAGFPFQYSGELHFADDPMITSADREQAARLGKFGNLCAPDKDTHGVLHCPMALQAMKQSNYHGTQTPPQ
jgi:protocatechuate 3,4-dioxygenase beta subunit